MTLARTLAGDIGERQVVARIDGGPPQTLYHGQSVTVELPPGEHRLRVHNTLVWRTVPFTVEAGEHRRFDILNYAPRFAFGLLAVVGAGPLFLKVIERSGRTD